MNWNKNITEFAYGIESVRPTTVVSGAYIASKVLKMPEDFFKRENGRLQSEIINMCLEYLSRVGFLIEGRPGLTESDYFKVGRKLSEYDREKLKSWALSLWNNQTPSDSEFSSLLKDLKN